MASARVALRGSPEVDEQTSASAAITPGDLIEIDTGQWRRHASAGLNATKTFALERDESGDGIDVDYAIDDAVKAGYFSPGQRVNAFIASGQTLSEGMFLESAGDGTLRELVTDAATDDTQRNSIVAVAAAASAAVVVKTRQVVIVA